MFSDLRIRHDPETRRLAARLFEKGYGFRSVASKLCLPPGTVKQWCYAYGAVGLEGLLRMGSSQIKYTYEQKLAAVEAVVEDGRAVADAMATFGIASRSVLQKWVKAYREGGAEALEPKKRGRLKGSKAKPAELSREEELEIRVRKLEAENAYLKKLDALRAEETLRTGLRPNW